MVLRVSERLDRAETAQASLTLSFEHRQRSRLRAKLDQGAEVGLMLPRGHWLRGGDRLRAENGLVIEVRAAKEAVSTAVSEDPVLVVRAAYHLGNRHVALQIGAGWVRYLQDYVLDGIIRSLGLQLVQEHQPFEPEAGAYLADAHHSTTHHDHG